MQNSSRHADLVSGRSDNPDDYWGFPDTENRDRTAEVVPIVSISATGLADANAARFEELAGLLGADVYTPELVAQNQTFDDKLAEFTEVATSQSALTSLFIYGIPDLLYVATPVPWADLAMFEARGQTVIMPDAPKGAYREELSWEQALKYPADAVFNTTRGDAFTAGDLKAHPTFKQHPAVKAGQIGVWNQDCIQSYTGLTETLETILTTLRTAKKVTAQEDFTPGRSEYE